MQTAQIAASAEALMAQARKTTAIDIQDVDIKEALERLLQSLNSEAQLNPEGARAMEARLLRVLCNRLRMFRDLAAHPEIREQQIVRPLILTGAGRTGSTKLHKMLAASGDFIHLPFWQGHSLSLRTGQRDEDPAPRIQEADEYIRWFDAHSPHAKSIHPFGTFEPEEEILILEHGSFGIYMMAFVFVPSFIQWSVTRYMEQLAFIKLGLQYLQWQFHDGDPRSWVLKCPLYFGAEAALAQVFPDAVFIATHRNPVSTLSSQVSLVDYYNRAYSDVERQPILGRMMLEGQAAAMGQLLASRDAQPALNVLDVGYSELTRHSSAVVSKIYAHAQLPLSDQAQAAMAHWERDNGQHKHGVHAHALADYGLDEAEVKDRYRAYMERFSGAF